LLAVFEVIRPALTQPSFDNALVIFAGWVLTNGSHAVTQSLVATDVARRRHWEAFHRFFSRGTWDPDRFGLLLLDRLAKLLPPGASIGAVLDDTLAPKKGPSVFGIGSHIDAVRSTKAVRVFCFGHVWVILAITIAVPCSRRRWALPVLFRLYRNKKECKAKGHVYRKKTELAREMLDVLIKWAGARPVELSMDSAYCNSTVMRGLPSSVKVYGAMRPDAVLTALPSTKRQRKGRPKVRGRLLSKPENLARNDRQPWLSCVAELYGEKRTVHYKTLDAQWYRACGAQLLRIVVVRVDHGAIRLRVFFSTDPNETIAKILEGYAHRWSIEVTFKNLKQLLGFADSSARKKESVERTAPFVGLIYTILAIWYMEGAHATAQAAVPFRPWYRHKDGLCFADVLRAAQHTLVSLDVLDPARSLADLRETQRRRGRATEPQAQGESRRAA
jgi:hypothetical protein